MRFQRLSPGLCYVQCLLLAIGWQAMPNAGGYSSAISRRSNAATPPRATADVKM